MPQQASKSGPTAASSPPTQRWPKIVAAPAVWESGAAASRSGNTPRSLYRPRRLAVDPAQRASLW